MSFLTVEKLKAFKKITDGDDGKWVYNRIMAVNCLNTIPKDKQDKLLKMHAEREGIVYQAGMV